MTHFLGVPGASNQLQEFSYVRNSPKEKDVYKYAAAMQSIIGFHPPIHVGKWKNLTGSQKRICLISVAPTTVEELRAVILASRRLGLRVRVAGKCYSWSPLFSDEGQVMLSTLKLQRPNGRPQIEKTYDPRDPISNLVTIAASASTGDFLKFQLDNDVCIPTNVVLRSVSMGGLIGTGCHGVGLDAGAVCETVESMRIMNSDGNLMEYSKKTDPDIIRAAQCSLGMFGIIVDMTIRVQPMVMVETRNVWISVKDLFYNQQNLCNMVYGNWSVEIFWFPFNSIKLSEAAGTLCHKAVDLSDWDPLEDDVLVRIINKIPGHHEPVTDSVYMKEDVLAWMQTKSLTAIDGIITKFPQSTPAYFKAQVKFLKSQLAPRTVQRLPYAVHYRDFIEKLPVHAMEWCFSMDRSCSNLSAAIQGVVEIVQKEAVAGRFPLTVALEARFVGYSESYLTPMVCSNPRYGGSGHACYIEIISLNKTLNWISFAENVAYLWHQLPGARPHWAKQWSIISGINEHLRKAYSLQLPAFLAALQRSGADPDGIFLNDFLEHIFYPGGFPGRRNAVVIKR